MDAVTVARVILYVRDIPKVAAFYAKYFGFRPLDGVEEGWLELASPEGGCNIALHQAAVSQKRGSAIKLAFAVRDVRAFKAASEAAGLKFGVVHETASHAFSNARDPAGTSIQISSRGLANSKPI